VSAGFTPPPLVWETLTGLKDVAEAWPGGAVDLTVGTPFDAPPDEVVHALGHSGSERGYPPSVGSVAFREACRGWMHRRLGVDIDASAIAATIGSKELVAGLPQWLHLRTPDRDTVLYPEISYPTYAMGAQLAGLRSVPVPAGSDGVSDLGSISAADAARALCLWVNSPGNPTGQLDDLGAAAEWGRARGVPAFSDECYVEFTWDGPPHTILEHGTDGVVAVHSLSKRSNLAGARCGFYAGDPDLVGYLSQLRKHAGFMVPGPVQAAAVVALDDDAHVDAQRDRYERRLRTLVGALADAGLEATMPRGAFYLWVAAPGGDGLALTRWFAEAAGTLATPGATYGTTAEGFVRLAVVQPDPRIDLAADRIRSARSVRPGQNGAGAP
jgi:succinyldiaminopimelate transaminase